jgi:Bacterial Ig-like domain (group 3)/Right handed beta helix region
VILGGYQNAGQDFASVGTDWVFTANVVAVFELAHPSFVLQTGGELVNLISLQGSYTSLCAPNVPSPTETLVTIAGGQTGGGGMSPSFTVLASSVNPSVVGQTVTLVATVTPNQPSVPTGIVVFSDGNTQLGQETLNLAGQAVIQITSFAEGDHLLTATYTGNGNYLSSTSTILSQVVNAPTMGGSGNTTTALSSSANPSASGQTVVFTATVTATGGGTPVGTVNFLDGATVIGSGTLDSGGTATFSTSTLSVTTHSITADFLGGGGWNTSTSSAVSQVVNSTFTGKALLTVANLNFLGYRTLPKTIDENAYGGLALRYHSDGSIGFFIVGNNYNIWEFNNAGGTWGSTIATAPRASLLSYGNWQGTLYGSSRLPAPGGNIANYVTEGLYYDPSTSRLYWMYAPNYDVGQGNPYVLGFFQFASDSTGTAYGPWQVDAGSHLVRDYMVPIPLWFQQYTSGYTLAMGAGLESGSIGSSWGPNLRAIVTPETSTPSTTVLTSIELVGYPELPFPQRYNRDPLYIPVDGTTGAILTTGNLQYELPSGGTGYWTGSDLMRGAAWIDNSFVSGLLVVGRLGYGDSWYGETPLENGISDTCINSKGEHSATYAARWFIYDPANLAKVAQGLIQDYQCPSASIIDPVAQWGLELPCRMLATGLAFDPTTNTLYAILYQADSAAGSATPGCVLAGWQVVSSQYYVNVSTGSDDNPGTQTLPWATVQNNTPTLKPGDTVNLEAGNYPGFIFGWDSVPAGGGDTVGTLNGTAEAPITFRAAPGAAIGSVVIDQKNNKTHYAVDVEPLCSYLVFQNLTISDTGPGGGITQTGVGGGFKLASPNCSIINCQVTSIYKGFGILADNANYTVIQGCSVSNVDNQGDGTYGHGIYISGSTGNATVQGCTIFDNTAGAIQCNGDASEGGIGLVTDAFINANIMYGNAGNSMNCDGLQSSTIQNNLIYGFENFGIVLFQSDAAGPSEKNVLVNNTVVAATTGSPAAAIRILDGGIDNTLYNNILIGGGGVSLRYSSDSLSGLVSNHNVFDGAFQNDGTLVTETLAQWTTATGQDANSLTSTPSVLFVSPGANDYLLLNTSPAIGAGTSTDAPSVDLAGNPRPNGTSYDIGCYEYYV